MHTALRRPCDCGRRLALSCLRLTFSWMPLDLADAVGRGRTACSTGEGARVDGTPAATARQESLFAPCQSAYDTSGRLYGGLDRIPRAVLGPCWGRPRWRPRCVLQSQPRARDRVVARLRVERFALYLLAIRRFSRAMFVRCRTFRAVVPRPPPVVGSPLTDTMGVAALSPLRSRCVRWSRLGEARCSFCGRGQRGCFLVSARDPASDRGRSRSVVRANRRRRRGAVSCLVLTA